MDKVNAKKIAGETLKRFEKAEKVFVTADGQVFLDEVFAKNHAKNNRTKKELEVFEFVRETEGN